MTPRTGLSLLVAGVIVAGAGWYFGPGQQRAESATVNAGTLLFPDLATKLQSAAELEISHRGQTLVIRRDGDHSGDRWGLADRGMYPVETSKLRGVLTGLTELRLAEPRTVDPANYARLGVENPDGKAAESYLVRVVDKDGKPILSLIVGHRRVLTQGNVPDEIYVRRPGEAQSWLAYGSLSVDSDPALWLDRDIMNIDHSRIAQVDVERTGAAKLVLDGKNGTLSLAEPAQYGALDDYKVGEVASALEQLTADDVHPGAAPVSGEIGHSVFTTADGMKITTELFHQDKLLLARFDVTGDGKSAAEAAKLEGRVKGWTYQLGTWHETALLPALSDLVKAPEKPGTATE